MSLKLKNFIVAVLLAIAAPTLSYSHSGGTDVNGCHSGSKLLHCHPSSPKTTISKNEKVCIYTYTRESGSYAYIGISNNPSRRWEEHKYKNRVFAWLDKSIHSCYTNRESAEVVEEQLIRQYCYSDKLYNKMYCLRS